MRQLNIISKPSNSKRMHWLRRFNRDGFPIAVALALSFVFCLWVGGTTAKSVVKQTLDEELSALVTLAAQRVDPTIHARLLDRKQQNDAQFQIISKPLKEFLQATPNAKYVYTLRQKSDRYYYVVDAADPIDNDEDGIVDQTQLGELYEQPNAALIECFRSYRVTITDKPYEYKWGTFISAYAPLLNERGELECVVAIDCASENYQARLQRIDWAMGTTVLFAIGVSLFFGSITRENRELVESLGHVAHHDGLTQLPNRVWLRENLLEVLREVQRDPTKRFAVLFLDLDHFKLINDNLGHDMGDLLLIKVADRLKQMVRANDQVYAARWGGDEFVLVFHDLGHNHDSEIIASRLLVTLTDTYLLGEHQIYTSPSIGIVECDNSYHTPEQVLRDVDIAMYEAKTNGKSTWVKFDQTMKQRVTRRAQLENDLRQALQEKQLYLAYQPIVDLRTEQICGYEALIRWQHPEQGLVPTDEFVSIAESCGQILLIGEWVLNQACSQLVKWRVLWGESAAQAIHVNLSRQQLAVENFAELVLKILKQQGLPPSCLHLEVTESEVMQNSKAAIRNLKTLRNTGVWIDIDDFGTGHSSLAVLHELPASILKIDRSFVSNIERSEVHLFTLQAITALSQNLKLKVIAEGVETPAQRDLLRNMKCEMAQGYLFGKPLRAEEIEPPGRNVAEASEASRSSDPTIPLCIMQLPILNSNPLPT